MNNQDLEPLSAILAEMRADECIPHHIDWAFRIEAATEREARAREQAAADYALKRGEDIHADRCRNCAARAPGDVAAMREALMDIVLLTVKAGKSIPSDVACGIIASKAKRALSAPPRNCDRFGDEQDAQLEFLNEVWLISVDKDSMLERDRFENWTDAMRAKYAKWLMAKTEGGAE